MSNTRHWSTELRPPDPARHAQVPDEAAFRDVVDRYRPELQLHCYRILGSFQDAEDACQETLVAAWRGLEKFEGRSSIRTWLYRVATNRCLNMLRSGRKQPKEVDSMLGRALLPQPSRLGEVLWLEPYPDALLDGVADRAPGPEARYETREAVSLAFIAALQLLPPRQRAVHILREVLGFHSKEVAEILDSTEESVTSALKRARGTLQLRLRHPREHGAPPPPLSPAELALVERFTRAFEGDDIDEVVKLLTEDVSISMPPLRFEWQGRGPARLVLGAVLEPGRRLLATRANRQPAFGLYLPDPHAQILHAVGLLVLTLDDESVSAITRFDTGVLRYFNLPRTLPT